MEYTNLLDYKIIIEHLESYQKAGENRRWDEYANRIPEQLRNTWRLILSECARNGFISPHVSNETLIFKRIETHGVQSDLCTLCRRECKKRDDIDTGETKWRRQNVAGYHEPLKCWKAN